ncbi:MAB_1171c family putative transporter [Actinophytocola sp.]|uniref:MAB_1171c family putative transporter n=1 Tax=Actinophytocola sp. TaxID=1872138 RepID=UPI003D6BD779
MPEEISFPAAAVVAAAGVVRWHAIRPGAFTHAQRHMLIALFAIAAALVLSTPTAHTAIQSFTGLPYAARLAANGLTLVAVFSVIVMVACVTAGPDRTATLRRKRRLAIALSITFALMTLGYASSDTAFDSLADLDTQYVVAQLAYWGFLGACVVRFIRSLSRYVTRHDVRPRMRAAMFFIVAAAVVGIVWVVFNVGGLVISYLTRQPENPFGTVSHGLAGAAAVLVAVGMTVPVVPVGYLRVVRRYRVARLLRNLTPMWRDLTTVVPTVQLRQAALDDEPSVLLYRRVIEIRDAELLLLPYAPAGIPDLVASSYRRRRRPDHAAVRSEAVALCVAIDRYRVKAPPFHHSATADDEAADAADLLWEARWLVRVHRAMRTDKAVPRLRQQAIALSERLES